MHCSCMEDLACSIPGGGINSISIAMLVSLNKINYHMQISSICLSYFVHFFLLGTIPSHVNVWSFRNVGLKNLGTHWLLLFLQLTLLFFVNWNFRVFYSPIPPKSRAWVSYYFLNDGFKSHPTSWRY